MSPNRKRFLRDNLSGLSLTLVGLLCAAAVTGAYLNRSTNSPFVLAQDKALGGPGISALQTLNKAYEQIARAVTPAIVSIQSTQVVKARKSPLFPQSFDSPDQGPGEERAHALGSGVLVSADGYILTN
jgi:S1-C subfamily serine protease